jgi:hypothetical protein
MMVDPVPPATGAWPNVLVTGEIAGYADANATPYRIFRLSQSDAPTSSLPMLEALNASGSIVYSMASDQVGTLYWAGTLNPLNTGYKWIVRRSGDGGTTWQELRRWDLATGMFARARGVTVDDQGSVYVGGMALDGNGYSHWIIKKSTDQGVTWQAMDLFKGTGACSIPTGYNMVEAFGITFVRNPNGGGSLFAVGTRGSSYLGRWTVTRSTDGGVTWQIVDSDSWVPRKIGTSRARKVAGDRAGRIFVLGDTGGRTEWDPSPWVVRMSMDGGNTWKTIFGPWNYGPCTYPLDLAIDADNNVWAVGVNHKPYGTKNVTYTSQATWVRLVESSPGTWTSSNGSLTAEAQGINRASADGVSTDDVGHVYVSGSFKADDATPQQWFVQRLVP